MPPHWYSYSFHQTSLQVCLPMTHLFPHILTSHLKLYSYSATFQPQDPTTPITSFSYIFGKTTLYSYTYLGEVGRQEVTLFF